MGETEKPPPRGEPGAEPTPEIIAKWARAPVWSPEEGVALALGLDPDEVVRAEPFERTELVAGEVGKKFVELCRRAILNEELPARAQPSEFILWAEGQGLIIHPIWHHVF